MRGKLTLLAGVCAGAIAFPAYAQDAAGADEEAAGGPDIVVTAQRSSQRLQDVPIAVSAFSGEALEEQQIENASDLQLTLPNVVFSKGNFTGASFTIRGIGDLCVGTSCDSATAIHVNGAPALGTRIFETEYFDLERVEVLRGPQGTLFGRNATSGVVNVVTAKPSLSGAAASVDAEYGNFQSVKVRGMVNVPLGDSAAVRIAGFYLNRDGFTENLFNNTRLDGRNMWAIRGSLRFEPGPGTRIDIMGYYFRERDDRMRATKNMCQRDATGVLGCLPAERRFEALNGNSTFTGVLSSSQFLNINGGLGAFALGSLYGPDAYATFVNPANMRQVRSDFAPEYFTDEIQVQVRVDQDLGDKFNLQVTGHYQKNRVDSRQDYNNAVVGSAPMIPGLTASAAFPGGLFAPARALLIPNGPTGGFCTSDTDTSGVGLFGGNKICSLTPLDFDRSQVENRAYSAEAIFSSKLDGPFNFLLGAIYVDNKTVDAEYYVNAFSIDYIAGLLGAATTAGQRGGGNLTFPISYLGTPYFRNSTPVFTLKSYGLFGEVYLQVNDKLKITGGIRYNNDKKHLEARSTLVNFPVPFGTPTAFASPFSGSFDADPGRTGNQLFQVRDVNFDAVTGRVVVDYKISDRNMLYASYSRGYKSGGINPPLQPVFAVQEGFNPEYVNAFEVGSKNTFADGKVVLNITGFYYQYKSLQLSRIVARTSVNDNVDANIYGLELEGILRPTPELSINIGGSYLHTEVSADKFLGNPRDPSGGRSDAVIIKDITNGSNCAVAPTTGGTGAGANTLVGAINGGLGLNAPTGFGAGSGLTATGAFGICSAIAGQIATPSAGIRALLGVPTGALPYEVFNAGVPVNIRGNKLPQAPNYKFNIGLQYEAKLSSGISITPRVDYIYTGESFGNIFNGNVNHIDGYSQLNAALEVAGPDRKWYVRGFISNVTDNDAITGLYVTDQSSGLFTNVFALDPRRYGLAVGMKF